MRIHAQNIWSGGIFENQSLDRCCLVFGKWNVCCTNLCRIFFCLFAVLAVWIVVYDHQSNVGQHIFVIHQDGLGRKEHAIKIIIARHTNSEQCRIIEWVIASRTAWGLSPAAFHFVLASAFALTYAENKIQ